MPGKLKWEPFGATGIKLYDLKLGIISEHVGAIWAPGMGEPFKNAFQFVTQAARGSITKLILARRCKRERW